MSSAHQIAHDQDARDEAIRILKNKLRGDTVVWDTDLKKIKITYPDGNEGDHEERRDFDMWRLKKANLGRSDDQITIDGNNILIEPDFIEPQDFQRIAERGPATERLYADEMQAAEEAAKAAAQPKGRSSGRR